MFSNAWHSSMHNSDLLGGDGANFTIGLFPGSRKQEITKMLPVMIAISEKYPDRDNRSYQNKLIIYFPLDEIEYDFSVRNSSGCIIQFIYGDDAMDACNVENQSFKIMDMDTEKLCKEYLFDKTTKWNKLLTKQTITHLKKEKQFMKILEESFYKILTYKEFIFSKLYKTLDKDNLAIYPIHLERTINNICKKSNKSSNISPLTILEKNETLKNKLKINPIFKNNIIIYVKYKPDYQQIYKKFKSKRN